MNRIISDIINNNKGPVHNVGVQERNKTCNATICAVFLPQRHLSS